MIGGTMRRTIAKEHCQMFQTALCSAVCSVTELVTIARPVQSSYALLVMDCSHRMLMFGYYSNDLVAGIYQPPAGRLKTMFAIVFNFCCGEAVVRVQLVGASTRSRIGLARHHKITNSSAPLVSQFKK